MAHEHLLHALTLGEPVDHLQGIVDRPIQIGVTAVGDFTRRIDGFAKFGVCGKAQRGYTSQRATERIHFSGGTSNIVLPEQPACDDAGFFGFIRQHRIDRNRHIGNGSAQAVARESICRAGWRDCPWHPSERPARWDE